MGIETNFQNQNIPKELTATLTGHFHPVYKCEDTYSGKGEEVIGAIVTHVTQWRCRPNNRSENIRWL